MSFFAFGLHYATVLSRRDPHFAGGVIEGTNVSLNARVLLKSSMHNERFLSIFDV